LPFDEPLDEAALYADEPVLAVPTVEAPPAFEQAASASSARTRTRMRSQGRPRPRPRQRRSGSSRNFLAVFLAFLVLASCAVGVLVTVVSLGGSVGESVGTALAPVGTALAPLVGTGLPDIAATLNPGGAAEPDGAPLADVVMRGRV